MSPGARASAAFTALIMAGGQGERMRRSLGDHPFGKLPKPLVPVRGVPLLERALLSALRAGIVELTVAAPASEPDIARFVRTRGRVLASAFGATIAYLDEARPLGTIGAAALLRGRREPLVVLNADNLTALDVAALAAHHIGHDATHRPSMTIATHEESFNIPFGKLRVREGYVTGYVEKPKIDVSISSGAYVLGPDAVDALPPGRPASIPWLVDRLLASGRHVRAFPHSAPWIDVNDAVALGRAEAMIADHVDLFEQWRHAADVEVAGAVIRGPMGVLLERRLRTAGAYPDVWDTPGGKLEPGESAMEAVRRELDEELGLDAFGARPLTRFDDIEPATGKVYRHHVFLLDVSEPKLRAPRLSPRLGQALHWMPLDGSSTPAPLCPVVSRSLAALGGGP